MKYLNPIKGLIVWTKNCIEIWLGGLSEVITTKDTYWDCRQTYFRGENAFKDREEYQRREDLLVKSLKE